MMSGEEYLTQAPHNNESRANDRSLWRQNSSRRGEVKRGLIAEVRCGEMERTFLLYLCQRGISEPKGSIKQRQGMLLLLLILPWSFVSIAVGIYCNTRGRKFNKFKCAVIYVGLTTAIPSRSEFNSRQRMAFKWTCASRTSKRATMIEWRSQVMLHVEKEEEDD